MEYISMDQNKGIEEVVLRSWDSSNEDEAMELVSIMVKSPSNAWLDLMQRAESHEVHNWHILLENSDRIYESIAEYNADATGNVIVDEQ